MYIKFEEHCKVGIISRLKCIREQERWREKEIYGEREREKTCVYEIAGQRERERGLSSSVDNNIHYTS